MTLPDSPLLAMQNVSKAFPGVKALQSAELTLRRGEIHALMGENGAGKSTMIKVLTGVHPRDSGDVKLDDVAIHPKAPLEAEACGISTVFQEVNLIPHLSVAENISLGRQQTRLGTIKWKQIKQRAQKALARFDVDIDVTRELCSYSMAIQQMVAIARAVDIDAKLLILDEPTSSLDDREVEELFTVMYKLRDQGMGILFVTHFLDQVYAVTDRITVLRNGETVGEYQTKDLPRIELIAHMLGKPVDQVTAAPGNGLPEDKKAQAVNAQSDTPLLSVTDFIKKGVMSPFNLQINKGQAVGLAGLLGSGRTETAKMVFGVFKPDRGETKHHDQNTPNAKSPKQAIARRIAFCSEDRKREGIIPNLSVRENIVLALQARQGLFRTLPRKQQDDIAERYIKRLRIKTPSPETPIRTLSGGNQQKVLLARWLATDPELIILDEPTRGIDIGAREEIEQLINELRQDGLSVLLISSELEEITGLCGKVYVLRDRRFVGTLEGDDIDEKKIMQAIAAPAPGSGASDDPSETAAPLSRVDTEGGSA